MRPVQLLPGAIEICPTPFSPPEGWQDSIEIIVPMFNHALYVSEAICSAASQHGQRPLTITIVDDRSTDDSMAIAVEVAAELEEHSPHSFRLISNVSNLRQWQSINVAVGSSRSMAFIVLNDDDILSPFAVESLVAAIESRGPVALVGGHSIWFTQTPPTEGDFAQGSSAMRLFGPRNAERFRRLNDLNMTHSGTFFFREAWDAVGGYRPPSRRIHPSCNEDRDFQMRVCGRFPVGVLEKQVMAAWRSDSTHGKNF